MEQQNLPVCIYHKDCFDGTAAAWIVWDYFEGQVQLVPCGYDYKGLDGVGFLDRTVYIVDFSLPPKTLECLCADAEHVYLLDHHIGAKEKLIASGWKQPDNLIMIFDMKAAGCWITWDFFRTSKPRPVLLSYIGDRDLWNFYDADTKPAMARLGSMPWKEVHEMADCIERIEKDHKTFIKEGQLLLDKEEQEYQTIRKGLRWHWIDDFIVPVLNCPAWLVSEAGNRIMQELSPPFVVLYNDTEDSRKWSLRSTDQAEDVNKIASQFGGGGHRNAAGFSTDLNFMFPIQES